MDAQISHHHAVEGNVTTEHVCPASHEIVQVRDGQTSLPHCTTCEATDLPITRVPDTSVFTLDA